MIGPSLMSLRRNNIYQQVDLGFVAHRTEKINCYCLSHPNGGTCYNASGKQILPVHTISSFSWYQNTYKTQPFLTTSTVITTPKTWLSFNEFLQQALAPTAAFLQPILGTEAGVILLKCTSNNETPLNLT